jgi:hypothetical protein
MREGLRRLNCTCTKNILVSTILIKPVMNRTTPALNSLTPVNEPITPVKAGLRTQRAWLLTSRGALN